MKRYKVELFCKIVAFHDLIVEADSVEEAAAQAVADAKQLSTHDWDLETVEDIEPNLPPYEVEEVSHD